MGSQIDGDGYYGGKTPPPLVTLGPSGTCSETVVLRNTGGRLPQAQVLLADTYEEAANLVIDGTGQMLIVAAAYCKLNNLVFGVPRKLKIVDAFVDDTPAIVIASRSPSDSLNCLAAMPAPAPLVHQKYPKAEIQLVNSNAAAADAVVRGEATGCVTTDIAARQRGLFIHHSFGVEPMAWVVMQRRN